jgi:hypothetical protein
MSTLTAVRIRDHAARLGLTHLSDTITDLVTRAETAQIGYLDFVDLLLEEEVGLREGRRFRNALKLSGLPHHKTLEDFDFAFQPSLDAAFSASLELDGLPVLVCGGGPTALSAIRGVDSGPLSPSSRRRLARPSLIWRHIGY